MAATGFLIPTGVTANGWDSGANVLSPDGARATKTFAGEEAQITVWGFSGLSIPAGATIDGIEVKVEGSATAPVDYAYHTLVNANTYVPRSVQDKSLLPGTTETAQTMGAGDDAWGGSSNGAWTPADFTPLFGVELNFGAGNETTVSINSIQLQVTYSAASSAGLSFTSSDTASQAYTLSAKASLPYENVGAASQHYDLTQWGLYLVITLDEVEQAKPDAAAPFGFGRIRPAPKPEKKAERKAAPSRAKAPPKPARAADEEAVAALKGALRPSGEPGVRLAQELETTRFALEQDRLERLRIAEEEELQLVLVMGLAHRRRTRFRRREPKVP